jgi:hypothetical protein
MVFLGYGASVSRKGPRSQGSSEGEGDEVEVQMRVIRTSLVFVAVLALGLIGVRQFAGAVTIPEGSSAIICHATPPDGPANKFVLIVTDDETIANGHLTEHDADILLDVIDKPPQQVTPEERDAFLEECNEQLPPPPPPPPVEETPEFTG